MTAKKRASRRSLGSDLKRVDAHKISRKEYEELPELNEAMLARASVRRGGRPVSADPRKLISLRIPASSLARWKASGAGWQTRMVQAIDKATPRTS